MLLHILWNIFTPIVLIMTTGVVLRRQCGIDVRPLSTIAFYVLLPCLVFTNLLHLHLLLNDVQKICLLHIGMLVLLLGLAWLLARLGAWDRPLRNACMLTAIMQNAGNYGLPVSHFAFGAPALEIAVLYHALTTITGNTLGVVLSAAGSTPLRRALGDLLKAPLLHAMGFAIVCRISALPLPAPLLRSIELCAQASVPLLLLILGMQLAQLELSTELGSMAWAALLRLGLSPLCALLLVSVLGMQGLLRPVSILAWSVPTGVSAAVVALQYECHPRYVAGVILLTTLLSFLTLPLLLFWVMP